MAKLSMPDSLTLGPSNLLLLNSSVTCVLAFSMENSEMLLRMSNSFLPKDMLLPVILLLLLLVYLMGMGSCDLNPNPQFRKGCRLQAKPLTICFFMGRAKISS